jgi:hypothetical protein
MWFDSLQVQHEQKCLSNRNCTTWGKPFVGAIEPHTDNGGLHNVRIVFSFAAVTANEEGEDAEPFNSQTMHAGADLAACCATVIGREQNGTVTLQVGGVGFHAVGPLSPGCLRMALLYNVVLVREIDFESLCQLPPRTIVNASYFNIFASFPMYVFISVSSMGSSIIFSILFFIFGYIVKAT